MRRHAFIQLLQDGVLAGVLAAVAIAEIWVPFDSIMGEGSPVVATAVAVFSCALLTVRRLWPLLPLVCAVVWPLVFAISSLPVLFWGQLVPLAIAVYSVARHGRGHESLLGAAAAAGLLLFFDFFVEELSTPSEIIFHWLVIILSWLAGRGLRVSEARAVAAALTAAEVESSSRERTLLAIAEERVRIARELHDVVAHSVTVMVVQAGAAEQAVDDDAEFVRSALGTIRTTGIGALGEMRRVVAMLREPGEEGALQPAPGLAGLAALIEQTRASGQPAELRVEGDGRNLPADLDQAVDRIVQEALTNVRRHAGACSVQVLIRVSSDAVEVQVRDDGGGAVEMAAVSGGKQAGHGLIGMRERAALCGGRLETHSEPGAGFTVRAVLPLAART